MMLQSSPYYLISDQDAGVLRQAFDAWLQEMIPTTWPGFDSSTLGPEALQLVGAQVHLVKHRSSDELNSFLRSYQIFMREDYDEGRMVRVFQLIGLDMDLQAIRETRNIVPSILQKCVNGIVHRITASEPSEAETDSVLPPIPDLAEFMKQARDSFREEAADLSMDLEPVVTWDRLSRVVRAWTEDHMPPNEGITSSQIIFKILESMYDEQQIMETIPQVADLKQIIEIVLDDENYTDSEVLKQVLCLMTTDVGGL
jgi:hypothetical protein